MCKCGNILSKPILMTREVLFFLRKKCLLLIFHNALNCKNIFQYCLHIRSLFEMVYLRMHLLYVNYKEFSGDHRRSETHVPIPNTLVKAPAVDGSVTTLLCESRSLPGFGF